MDIKSISVALVAIMVGAVAFGAMLPIFQDVTATEDTFTNDGFYRMKEIKNGDTWVKISGGTWTYNTDDVIIYSNGGYNMVLGDEWCVRGNGTARGTFVSGGAQDTTVVSANDVITITGTGISSNDTPAISGYGGCSTGSYLLTDPSKSVYVKPDTPIYATGTTEISASGSGLFHIEGTIKDGFTITAYSVYSTTPYDSITTSNVVVNYSPVSGYVELYKLDSITFDIEAVKTIEGTPTTYTTSATYNSYVVPYEVTAERAIHGDSGFNTIVNLIPLVIGMGLLLIAVWWFVVRKF